MNQPLYVKPAPGLRVRLPDRPGQHLPEEGAEVPRSPYWTRRLADGSVIETKPPRKTTKREGDQ